MVSIQGQIAEAVAKLSRLGASEEVTSVGVSCGGLTCKVRLEESRAARRRPESGELTATTASWSPHGLQRCRLYGTEHTDKGFFVTEFDDVSTTIFRTTSPMTPDVSG
ncbi:hypothetical protein BaRGS_00012102 [Batillaria attramentaria]|uniref:Uncharacterized protein n=1 Tax=Batillaria attramentaria TaxID=370345 RepID=A0ABD0LBI4_9CAEN